MVAIAPLEYITQDGRTKLVPPTEQGIRDAKRASFVTGYRIPRPTVDIGYSHLQTLSMQANPTERDAQNEIAVAKKKFYDFMSKVPGFSVISTEEIREKVNLLGMRSIYIIIVYVVEPTAPIEPEPAYARFQRDPSALVS